MAVSEYDLVFVCGGLGAPLFMRELGSDLPDGVAVVDPHLPQHELSAAWRRDATRS